jgi:metal-responsive CopG/Arc/MetJ family transcriptional regulator
VAFDIWYNHGYTVFMKTAISVPDTVFRSAETLAKRLGVSRSKLYAKAVSEYVSRHSRSEITRRLNEIYATENSHVDSVLTQMQWASLQRDKWK